MVVVKKPTLFASCDRVRSICSANSRVGASTSARGLRASRGWLPAAASIATSGTPTAMVLPLPVLPRPRTSCPAIATGMVAAWIGKGVAAPILASSWVRRSGRSISWKVAKVAASVALSRRSSLTSCEKVLPVELLARAPSKLRLRSLSRATRSGRSEKVLRAGSKSRPPVRGLRSPSKSRAARGLRSAS